MKREYIILAIVIVLLTAYLVFKKSDLTHYTLPELPEVKGKEITKLVITKGDRTITLVKKDGQWQIMPQGYDADKVKIKGLIDIIEDLKLVTLVSESKNYAKYELDKDKKITVRAYKGETPLREFEIGKPAPSYRHTFVKLVNDHRVYHAQDNFRYRFDLTVQQLRDKTVMSFNKDEIKEVVFEEDRETLTAVKMEVSGEKTESEEKDEEASGKKTLWKSKDGKSLNEEKIKDILTTLSNLKCDDYIEGKEKADFKDPIYSLTLKGVRSYSLSIYKKEDEKYPALSSENRHPFYLSSWKAEKLMKGFDELTGQK